MVASFDALLPIFLTILVGVLLQRTRLVGDDMWSVLEHVCYYVMFPALMFQKIATADLSTAPVFEMASAMLLAICTMFALLLAIRVPLMSRMTVTGAAFSSVFQGASRWNTFVALSIIGLLLGEEGLTLVAIGMAAMIPVLNIVNVTVVSMHADGRRPGTGRIVSLVVRNPLVLACAAGIVANATGLPVPGVIARTLDLIGAGALGVGLLTVGAALQLRAAMLDYPVVLLTSALRLIGMPFLMFLWTSLLGVEGMAQTVAIISGAVPTASASYILARQLGGDAVLMANIITAETIAAVITLPVVLWLVTG